jgi:hypothetical protein
MLHHQKPINTTQIAQLRGSWVMFKGIYGMIKPNLILLVCITLFFIIPVNFAYAQEKLSQEPASIRKDGINNPIGDTGQVKCYDNSKEILYPKPGQPFYGQDAQNEGNAPSYRNNGDGTVTDLNTGLIWSKAVDKKKVSLIEAKKMHREWYLADILAGEYPT